MVYRLPFQTRKSADTPAPSSVIECLRNNKWLYELPCARKIRERCTQIERTTNDHRTNAGRNDRHDRHIVWHIERSDQRMFLKICLNSWIRSGEKDRQRLVSEIFPIQFNQDVPLGHVCGADRGNKAFDQDLGRLFALNEVLHPVSV